MHGIRSITALAFAGLFLAGMSLAGCLSDSGSSAPDAAQAVQDTSPPDLAAPAAGPEPDAADQDDEGVHEDPGPASVDAPAPSASAASGQGQQPAVDWDEVVADPPGPVVDPWSGAPTEDGALIGWLEQDRIPAFEARISSAEARLAALKAYTAGEGSLSAALPDLPRDALFEPELIDARLRIFDVRGERRARGQARPVPTGTEAGAAAVQDVVSEAVQRLRAAHEAEAAADDAERGLLLSARAWLREHPELSAAGLEDALRPWRDRARSTRGLDATDPASEARLARGLEASEALSGIERTLALLRDHRLVGADLEPERAALVTRLAELTSEASPEPLPTQWSELRRIDGVLLRLGWIRDALPPGERGSLQTPIEAALAVRVAAFQAAIGAVPRSERRTVQSATRALQLAEAHRDALPAALSPLGQARVDLADAQLVHAEAPVLAAEADAAATRRQAQEARQNLDATAERTAALISARIPAEERVSALDALVTNEATEFSTQRDDAAETLSDARAVANALGAPTRPANIDERYGELRTLVSTLRQSARDADDTTSEATGARRLGLEVVEAERQRIAVETRALDDLAEPSVRQARKASLDQWAGVLDAEVALLNTRVENAEQARDDALRQLNDAVELRHELSAHASREQRRQDNDILFKEIIDEVSVVGPAYVATLRDRMQQVEQDPWWFIRLQVLGELALGSLWLIGAAVVWLVARRYADALVVATMRRVAARSRRIRDSDVEPLRDPLHRLLVTTVDVVAAWMLFGMVPTGLPELSVVLLLVFEVQLVRLIVAVYDTLVAENAAARPALLRLSTKGHRLGRRTVLAVALWLSTFRVLRAFVDDVIAGFATGALLSAVRLVALVVLIVVLLYAWAPSVRARIARHPRQSRATRFLGAEPPTVILAGPQALGGIVFLTTVLLRDLVFRIARQGAVSRWFSTVDRLRLGRVATEADAELAELPDAIAERLTDKVSERAFIDRPKARAALVGAVEQWREDRRQGLVALLGDTGDGRGAALRRWSSDWQAKGVGTTWVGVEHRLVSERDALAWIGRTFELSEVPETVDAALEALELRLEPGVVVVTGLHLAFLRTVGGFDALRTLLEVLHADRERCWILCFYRPSWRYLERLGTAMNIHLVQQVVDLTALDGEALREMTTKLAAEDGFILDFQSLASTGALAGDPEVERERAIESYYRLLASASAGNPAVALDLWVRCLSLVEGSPKLDDEGMPIPGRTLAVRLAQDVRVTPMADLGDDQLFVLAAVRVQGELDEQELSEVLNMGRSQVRAIVRQLLSAELLCRTDRGVFLDRSHLPSVTLTLRRRHFLHWSTP